MGKVEASSKFAGIKNNPSVPFNFKIEAMNLAVFPGAGYAVNLFFTFDLDVKQQLVDIQFSLPGFDERHFYLATGAFLAAYDSNLVPRPVSAYNDSVELTIDQYFVQDDLRFRVQYRNGTAVPVTIPAHKIEGTIMLFDTPFSTNF